MKLRVINPAFIEAMKRRGIDVSRRLAGGYALVCLRPVSRRLLFAFQTPTIPTKALADHVRPQRLGSANGMTILAMNIGQALVMLTALTVLAPVFHGWRPFQMFAGFSMIIVAVLWLIFVRDPG